MCSYLYYIYLFSSNNYLLVTTTFVKPLVVPTVHRLSTGQKTLTVSGAHEAQIIADYFLQLQLHMKNLVLAKHDLTFILKLFSYRKYMFSVRVTGLVLSSKRVFGAKLFIFSKRAEIEWYIATPKHMIQVVSLQRDFTGTLTGPRRPTNTVKKGHNEEPLRKSPTQLIAGVLSVQQEKRGRPSFQCGLLLHVVNRKL